MLTFISIIIALTGILFAQDHSIKSSIERLDVYHKLPNSKEFKLRGYIDYDSIKDSIKYIPLTSLKSNDIFNKEMNGIYQIAIAKQGTLEENWSITYTKLCDLKSLYLKEDIILHIDKENQYYHFDYYMTCEKEGIETNFLNSPQLITRKAITSMKPILNKPVQVKIDGTVEQPLPEKSFLQKYWFIIAAVIFFLFAGSSPPDSPGQGQNQGRSN